MNVLNIKNLTYKYENLIALKNVSFSLNKLDFLGVIGPNGGGKTTLLKCLLGILPNYKGSIEISNNQVFGYVPQYASFDKSFPIRVKDVILTGHLPSTIRPFFKFKKAHKEHAFDVMEELGIIDLSNRQIGRLSGGQLQKVLIARALMNHPTLLVLDEPTSGIDTSSKKDIYSMLNQLNKTHTIILVSHSAYEISDSFNKVLYINLTGHMHETSCLDEEQKNCPIDWFLEGEKLKKAGEPY